jgi:glycerophosphoryl diester phosphodiesterase
MGSNTIFSIYNDLSRPVIFAHRGASAYVPENTLAAFKLAFNQHADAIELDAQLTRDDQIVVMHDDTVDRTTNGSGRVRSLTLAELKGLDAGSKLPPLFKPENVPSLEDIFEEVGRKLLINVELKNYASPTDDLPDRVVALVKKFNLEDRIILSSFNMIALIRAKKAMPKIMLGLLTFPHFADATIRFKLIRFGPLLAFHPNYEDVNPSLVQFAHSAKCLVNTYTVNQPDVMMQVITAGVDGIITHDPLLAHEIIANYK